MRYGRVPKRQQRDKSLSSRTTAGPNSSEMSSSALVVPQTILSQTTTILNNTIPNGNLVKPGIQNNNNNNHLLNLQIHQQTGANVDSTTNPASVVGNTSNTATTVAYTSSVGNLPFNNTNQRRLGGGGSVGGHIQDSTVNTQHETVIDIRGDSYHNTSTHHNNNKRLITNGNNGLDVNARQQQQQPSHNNNSNAHQQHLINTQHNQHQGYAQAQTNHVGIGDTHTMNNNNNNNQVNQSIVVNPMPLSTVTVSGINTINCNSQSNLVMTSNSWQLNSNATNATHQQRIINSNQINGEDECQYQSINRKHQQHYTVADNPVNNANYLQVGRALPAASVTQRNSSSHIQSHTYGGMSQQHLDKTINQQVMDHQHYNNMEGNIDRAQTSFNHDRQGPMEYPKQANANNKYLNNNDNITTTRCLPIKQDPRLMNQTIYENGQMQQYYNQQNVNNHNTAPPLEQPYRGPYIDTPSDHENRDYHMNLEQNRSASTDPYLMNPTHPNLIVKNHDGGMATKATHYQTFKTGQNFSGISTSYVDGSNNGSHSINGSQISTQHSGYIQTTNLPATQSSQFDHFNNVVLAPQPAKSVETYHDHQIVSQSNMNPAKSTTRAYVHQNRVNVDRRSSPAVSSTTSPTASDPIYNNSSSRETSYYTNHDATSSPYGPQAHQPQLDITDNSEDQSYQKNHQRSSNALYSDETHSIRRQQTANDNHMTKSQMNTNHSSNQPTEEAIRQEIKHSNVQNQTDVAVDDAKANNNLSIKLEKPSFNNELDDVDFIDSLADYQLDELVDHNQTEEIGIIKQELVEKIVKSSPTRLDEESEGSSDGSLELDKETKVRELIQKVASAHRDNCSFLRNKVADIVRKQALNAHGPHYRFPFRGHHQRATTSPSSSILNGSAGSCASSVSSDSSSSGGSPLNNHQYITTSPSLSPSLSNNTGCNNPANADNNTSISYSNNIVGRHNLERIATDSVEEQKILLWQQFAILITPSIQQVVEFAKQVPGFLSLIQQDQLQLIKSSFFEIWMVTISRMFNTTDNTLTFSDGTYIDRHQMDLMFDESFSSLALKFSMSFNQLCFDDTEIGLVSAIILLRPRK